MTEQSYQCIIVKMPLKGLLLHIRHILDNNIFLQDETGTPAHRWRLSVRLSAQNLENYWSEIDITL